MAQQPCFQVGLVMAGAVSAGAYTGGVVDFLIEALDDYNAAKKQPDWDGPAHDVFLPVITGASAGGMTAGILALELFRALEHVNPGKPAPAPERNRLYSSWVTDISIERLLETTDLKDTARGVISALCCRVLDEIVDRAFNLGTDFVRRPWVGSPSGDPLKVMLTVTNLRGVPYSFELFGGKNAQYGMLNHADYLEFTVAEGAGGPNGLDPSKPASASERFKTACLATGAFPIGLAARPLSNKFGDYKRTSRVLYKDSDGVLKPVPPANLLPDDADYDFISVDGGVIDNEPFELARRALAGGPNDVNPRSGDEAKRAVLLIDPFPNAPILPKAASDRELVQILKMFFPALMDQARFKPDELVAALSDVVYSRFVIAPERGGATPAIASGVLGGFSGFLHRSFRHHDYLLGRRNAQAFLRWHFALPERNPLFATFEDAKRKTWYVENPPNERALPPNLQQFPTTLDPHGPTQNGLPIIPLTKRMLAPIELGAADLPQAAAIDMESLRELVTQRAYEVVSALVQRDLKEFLALGWPADPILRWGAVAYGHRTATNVAMRYIEQAKEQVLAAFPR
jgi:hypothetical protein